MSDYRYIQATSESFSAHKDAVKDPDYTTVSIRELEYDNLGVKYMHIHFTDFSEGVHFGIKHGLNLPGYTPDQ